ncbi:MAG: Asp23/Gls24 family envelope stress response protein [Clostridiaceae bacterium]|nr:Asp23/Gls24 family envelope stress response protein [Clostridiaceae bacterium]
MVDTKIRKESYGIIISLDLSIFYGSSTQDILTQVQAAVSEGVEFYTSINVLAINVRAMRVAKKRSKESIDAMKAKLHYEPGSL